VISLCISLLYLRSHFMPKIIRIRKEQLLAEQLKVREVVNKALCYVTVVKIKVEDRVM
jgi:hypothetical protein